MKIIVPCCGRSSRFPNLPPKWLLPSSDGRPMIEKALAGLNFDPRDLVVTLLLEHEQRFDVTAGLERALGRPIRTCVLEQPTRSQADTVAQTLRALRMNEPFFVKDSDGAFTLDEIEQPRNYVCVETLNHCGLVHPTSKSYVRLDADDRVVEIREKVVISDTFNVGGYYFTDPAGFLEHFDRLTATNLSEGEIYLSHIIAACLANGGAFYARRIGDYRDWGTLRDWRRARRVQQAYFVSLDGFVFERGNEYFRPRFEEVEPHAPAIAALKSLAESGHRIIYYSIRPASLESMTRRRLADAGAPEGAIVFACPITLWSLIAAPDAALPADAAHAATLSPMDVVVDQLLQRDDENAS